MNIFLFFLSQAFLQISCASLCQKWIIEFNDNKQAVIKDGNNAPLSIIFEVTTKEATAD
jgi:hypothetical protein